MDLTFDSGYYNIASKKNGIHACANNSLITMYDANIVVDVSDEGNGIESNGDIYINGGTVYAFSNAEDKNGLKSNLGISIDGGTVLSTGTKYEKLQTENDNEIIQMKFAQTLNPGENIIIVDRNNIVAIAGSLKKKYLNMSISDEIDKIIQKRNVVFEPSFKEFSLIPNVSELSSYIIAPIIGNGDAIGAVIMMSTTRRLDDFDVKTISIAAKFLGKYIEE